MTLKWSILDPFGVSQTLRSIDLEVSTHGNDPFWTLLRGPNGP